MNYQPNRRKCYPTVLTKPQPFLFRRERNSFHEEVDALAKDILVDMCDDK